jgi:AraC-like DNA-binding protein
VQKVKDPRVKAISTLERLLGEEARIISRAPVFINRFVRAEFLKLEASNNFFPEDEGRLFLYPIDDNQYNLHILYKYSCDELNEKEVLWLEFLPEFFNMFEEEFLQSNTPFRFDQITELQFNICNPTKIIVERLKQIKGFTPLLESLHLTEISIQLLRKTLENVTVPFTVCPVPACRFLAYESERVKIADAKKIMEQTIDQPLTIKELSRKVAINECYLKKGFKTLTGKTINEYQQELRINKAKELLVQDGQTVSEVAGILGYSSISHFSSAFKKATGLKPCELLG